MGNALPSSTKTASTCSLRKKRGQVVTPVCAPSVNTQRKNVRDDYELLHCLGEGVTGQVHAVKSYKQGIQLAALKEADINSPSGEERERLLRNEIGVLRSISHPCIVKPLAFYESDDRLSMVMEYCCGGNLCRGAPYQECDAQIIVAQLVDATRYLHRKQIVHRDLKMENILLVDETTGMNIKIIDFGLACRVRKSGPIIGRAGTTYTMSPQVIQGHYDCQADMWAIGVIAFILLSGEGPFSGDTREEMESSILEANVTFQNPIWRKVSNDAKLFIRTCLRVDPKLRCTAESAAKSRWLSSTIPKLLENQREYSVKSQLLKQ